MPFAKCPTCGTVYHLGVGDVDAWYAEYWPSYSVGEIVPVTCFYCWQKQGDKEGWPEREASTPEAPDDFT